MGAGIWGQLCGPNCPLKPWGSSAEPYHSSPPLPTGIASTWRVGVLLGSHPEPGSSREGNQALAEAAARPAWLPVPGCYRAGWDGRSQPAQLVFVPSLLVGPCGLHVEEEALLGCLVPQGGGWIKGKPKHPAVLVGREAAYRGGEMGCPAPLPGLREKPQTLSNPGLLGHQLPQSYSFLVTSPDLRLTWAFR